MELKNFRCFDSLKLEFPELPSVLVTGSNGRGKTSLLEAIFYLANLRSFRTQKLSELPRIGKNEFCVSANVEQGKKVRRYSAASDGASRRLDVDGCKILKASEFAGSFAAVAFLPSDSEIITSRPPVRRRFLDMYISSLDREYFTSLQSYGLALRSRNAVLRTSPRETSLVRSYHPLLARYGSLINSKRLFHLRILNDFMRAVLEEIRPSMADLEIRARIPHEAVEAEYFESRLVSGLERDIEKRYTLFGPQSDDFDFISGGRSLRIYGSRGQCAAVALALKTAQFDITRGNPRLRDCTIALADDVTGDLDAKTRDSFFEKLSTAHQTFFTFTEKSKYTSSRPCCHIDLELFTTNG